jgi:hypothetical protein
MFKWLTGGEDSGSFWPEVVVSGMTSVLSAASSVASAAASVIEGVVDAVGSAASAVGGFISSVGSAIGGAVSSFVSGVASFLCFWCRRDMPSESPQVLKASVLGAAPLTTGRKKREGELGDKSAGGNKRFFEFGCLSTGTVYTATSGTVSDGSDDYLNNADCYWVISVPGTTITLTFTRLDTEESFDFVSVHSCPTAACASTTELQGSPFSGATLPNPVVSSTGHMKIMFTSDGSVGGAGFEARYSTACIAGSASTAAKCSSTGAVLT